MLVDERRTRILQLVEEKGFVSLHDLVEFSQASESTIRRDLEHLDRIGQIRRTHGGAAYVGESLTSYEVRESKSLDLKQRVARAVAQLIEPGEAVLMDGGTTTYEVARHLAGKSLQVVTNSIPIVNLLVNQPKIELVVIGGYVYPKTGVALGPLATAALSGIHVRRLIMSVGGITEAGLYNSNALLVETERQMMAAAEETVVVTDSSKLGHSALSHLCGLDKVHRLVVDSGISDEWRKVTRDAGIELTVVENGHKQELVTDSKLATSVE
jgi:DeoR family transcriptional regulator, fructose operon transcriptional repressor